MFGMPGCVDLASTAEQAAMGMGMGMGIQLPAPRACDDADTGSARDTGI